MKVELTDTKVQTAINAMYVAAEQYERTAKDLQTIDGHGRMAAQFTQQAKETRALAEEFEQAETVELVGG